MRIVFTPSARDQFLQALAYIRRDKPSAAVSFRQKVEEILSRLRDYPESGRTLPEFSDSHFREIIVTPYRFFYRIKKDVVWVVAVWHGAQIPEDPSEESANKPLS
ncbi:plasmid stabilization system protein ParE [Desulfuromonas soudanensis]|uniref:Plasmid stabilization system protein ParE n=1 Tax=Desulfuromonas soudanensis TaxID=1603606 RepID=A0A0M3QF87_9BACT|nr:type II toxin-antitoxin system RelE/ParE family toxin [Desulfuromonas soudanensis]ALC15789.1 plasmid stabilization system protein ParE [Desulfuromonas soudanensis]